MKILVTRSVQTPIMHRVVSHRGVLHLGGVVADDLELDVTGQMRQVCRKLDDLLTAHGSGNDRLLSVLVFLSDFALKAEMDVVWKEWLPAESLPARATVAVADLGGDVLVELVCTAATTD